MNTKVIVISGYEGQDIIILKFKDKSYDDFQV